MNTLHIYNVIVLSIFSWCHGNEDSLLKTAHLRPLSIENETTSLYLHKLIHNVSMNLDFQELQQYVEDNPEFLRTSVREILMFSRANQTNLHLKYTFNELIELFRKLDAMYEAYQLLKRTYKTSRDERLSRFIDRATNLYDGALEYLHTISHIVLGKDIVINNRKGFAYSLLSVIEYQMKIFGNICDTHKSQQQMFLMLFRSFIAAEAKVWLILEYSTKILSQDGEANYIEEILHWKDLIHFQRGQISEFYNYVRDANREVWRCDPLIHKRGETYIEFEGLFQKYILYEEEINNQWNCRRQCSDYKTGAIATDCVPRTSLNESICFKQRKCSGALYDCTNLDGFRELLICPSDLYNTSRRYKFMLYWAEGQEWNYGPQSVVADCPTEITYNIQYSNLLFYYCGICSCTCHDRDNDVILNMSPVIADRNYVVTGVRFVKEGKVLHVQIQQGLISKEEYIIPETVHWKNISQPSRLYYTDTFNWHSLREFYLGVNEVPYGHVLTGLRLSHTMDGDNIMLIFKTISAEYDFRTGKLTKIRCSDDYQKDARDIGFDPYPNYFKNPFTKEYEVVVDELDLQTNSFFPSQPQPDTMKIVKLTTSNFQLDMGQSTIPFIDIQPVVTIPPMPLSGIGFYLKNTQGYGGFIGLKLLTYDVSKYF